MAVLAGRGVTFIRGAGPSTSFWIYLAKVAGYVLGRTACKNGRQRSSRRKMIPVPRYYASWEARCPGDGHTVPGWQNDSSPTVFFAWSPPWCPLATHSFFCQGHLSGRGNSPWQEVVATALLWGVVKAFSFSFCVSFSLNERLP